MGTDAADHDHGTGSRTAHVDIHALYQRGLDLLGRGSAAAAAQLLERAAIPSADDIVRMALKTIGKNGDR